MLYYIEDKFSHSYESSSTASYAVLTAKAGEKIESYQLKMISKNIESLKGFLPLDIRRKDDDINIYYNITSKLLFSQFLSRQTVSWNIAIKILLGITDALISCESYLLKARSFILSTDYMYIDPYDKQVYMMYVPVEQTDDVNILFKEFLIDLMVNKINIEASGSDSYFQKILSCLRRDTFNIGDMYNLLKELLYPINYDFDNRHLGMKNKENDDIKISANEKGIHEPETKKDLHEKPKIDIPYIVNIDEKRLEEVKEARESNKQKIKKENIQKSFKLRFKTSSIIIGGIIQSFLIGIILAAAFGGIFSGEEKLSKIFGIVVIVVGIDFLTFSRLFSKDKIIKKEIIKKVKENKLNNVKKLEKKIIQIPGAKKLVETNINLPKNALEEVTAADDEEFFSKPYISQQASSINRNEPKTGLLSGNGETELLSDIPKSKVSVWLESTQGSKKEKIEIDRDNFIISQSILRYS